jgi:hypothetical protein
MELQVQPRVAKLNPAREAARQRSVSALWKLLQGQNLEVLKVRLDSRAG